ncbi:hypothetical protein A2714_04775 [Candidatus Woesebacteria bacterium RIFCSPHIGHO2_01_FULL_38_9]|uniref:DUF2283 domain-containing protein n=2 Tax=Candidatus Woeseibacteriota TaxID=1752722 RepID=A0A1F7XZ67_9BACT|nr:MAG: hypothetical protein A2714_04775 [Candidatus Woesebacteria bacterium RIFCSPHIGHO2_01_FULL_38_9]OGM58861.1 MAG: hypothetical protein A3A75_06375 [Candidatus Woesebacteria bacterium RIFCSPLOWO2_01_FULL_39_10]
MKLKYYKDDDILVIRFSTKPVDDSFEVENAILEVDKENSPVSLEILKASKFFNIASKELPKEVKEKFFTTA